VATRQRKLMMAIARPKESQNERKVSSPAFTPLCLSSSRRWSPPGGGGGFLAKSTPETFANDVQQIVRISASTEPSPTRPTRKWPLRKARMGIQRRP